MRKPAVLLPLAALSLLLHGCATAGKVPQIKADDLPVAAFKALNPRTIQVEVKNNRPVNQKAGNTAEVEKAVLDAVSAVLARGGFAVKDGAPNRLSITVDDYTGKDMVDGDSECVKISGKLRAKWGSSLTAEADACHSLQRENGFAMAGDVSESYTLGLKLLIQQFEKHQMDLLRGSN